eukprot:1885791-Lingulodinium_polyedra.AAC.1
MLQRLCNRNGCCIRNKRREAWQRLVLRHIANLAYGILKNSLRKRLLHPPPPTRQTRPSATMEHGT